MFKFPVPAFMIDKMYCFNNNQQYDDPRKYITIYKRVHSFGYYYTILNILFHDTLQFLLPTVANILSCKSAAFRVFSQTLTMIAVIQLP